MSSTITAVAVSKIGVIETFSGNVSPTDATAGFGDTLGETFTLSASSSVPVTKHAEFTKALSTGAGTIDLTALPGIRGDTVDGTGLKVQLCKFRNPSTNANDISITFGASNPYNLLGSDFKITLKPGQSTGPIYLDDAAPDVGSGAKALDLAGTASQALECMFILG